MITSAEQKERSVVKFIRHKESCHSLIYEKCDCPILSIDCLDDWEYFTGTGQHISQESQDAVTVEQPLEKE